MIDETKRKYRNIVCKLIQHSYKMTIEINETEQQKPKKRKENDISEIERES